MDKTTSIITMICYGLPVWWVGLVMIMLFAFTFSLFPSNGILSVPPPETFFKKNVGHYVSHVFTSNNPSFIKLLGG